jgi:hypothetical protein
LIGSSVIDRFHLIFCPSPGICAGGFISPFPGFFSSPHRSFLSVFFSIYFVFSLPVFLLFFVFILFFALPKCPFLSSLFLSYFSFPFFFSCFSPPELLVLFCFSFFLF